MEKVVMNHKTLQKAKGVHQYTSITAASIWKDELLTEQVLGYLLELLPRGEGHHVGPEQLQHLVPTHGAIPVVVVHAVAVWERGIEV